MSFEQHNGFGIKLKPGVMDEPPILLNPFYTKPIDAIMLMDKEYLTYEKIKKLGNDFVHSLCIINGVSATDPSIDPMASHKALYSAILDRGVALSVRADAKTEALMIEKYLMKIKDSAPDNEKGRTGVEQQHSTELEKPVPTSPSTLFGLGSNLISGCDPTRPFVTFRAADEEKVDKVEDEKAKEGELKNCLLFDLDQMRLFIHLRGVKYKQYFEGNQNRKVIGWLNVLNDLGVQAIKENINMCKRKWMNLKNSYASCLTDEIRRSKYDYFDELDKIFQNEQDSTSPLYTSTLKKRLLTDAPDYSPVKKMKLKK